MFVNRMSAGQALAAEKERLRQEAKVNALRVKEEAKLKRASEKITNKIALSQERARRKELDANLSAMERKRKSREAFAKTVEAQNVKGVIPEVENRGMHASPSFNPFAPPEREKVRDRNGLFITRD